MQDTSANWAERQQIRKSLCKDIQKLVRRRNRLRKTERIKKILEDFKGLKHIPRIKNPRANKRIQSMMDSTGGEISSKNGSADVFADFYAILYASLSDDSPVPSAAEEHRLMGPLDEVTIEELCEALRSLKRGRCKDERGIVAEMLKDGSHCLFAAMAELFNDVMLHKKHPPDEWRRTKLIVIFKKGDPKLPANYRPIAILPILYKLFSRILCNRLQAFLMPHQSVDQAAYRKGFSTEDHLLTVSLLIEKSREFNFPIWLGLVDYQKAFDTVEHEPLWQTLTT